MAWHDAISCLLHILLVVVVVVSFALRPFSTSRAWQIFILIRRRGRMFYRQCCCAREKGIYRLWLTLHNLFDQLMLFLVFVLEICKYFPSAQFYSFPLSRRADLNVIMQACCRLARTSENGSRSNSSDCISSSSAIRSHSEEDKTGYARARAPPRKRMRRKQSHARRRRKKCAQLVGGDRM